MTPNSRAARALLPFDRAKARRINSRSTRPKIFVEHNRLFGAPRMGRRLGQEPKPLGQICVVDLPSRRGARAPRRPRRPTHPGCPASRRRRAGRVPPGKSRRSAAGRPHCDLPETIGPAAAGRRGAAASGGNSIVMVLSCAASSAWNVPRRASSASGAAAVTIGADGPGAGRAARQAAPGSRPEARPRGAAAACRPGPSVRCAARPTASKTAATKSAPEQRAVQRQERRVPDVAQQLRRLRGRQRSANLPPRNGWRRPGAAGRCPAALPARRSTGCRPPIRPGGGPGAWPVPGQSGGRTGSGPPIPGENGVWRRAASPAPRPEVRDRSHRRSLGGRRRRRPVDRFRRTDWQSVLHLRRRRPADRRIAQLPSRRRTSPSAAKGKKWAYRSSGGPPSGALQTAAAQGWPLSTAGGGQRPLPMAFRPLASGPEW